MGHPRRSRRVVVMAMLLLLSACGDSSSPSQEPAVPLPVGLAALTDLMSLAELRPPGQQVLQVSSYDRTGGNNDLGVGLDSFDILEEVGLVPVELDNSFLYRDGDRYVIFDSLGPGVVYRIWMTAFSALLGRGLNGDIAFEFDDEATPRLQLDRNALFSGNVPPFITPLAGNDAVSSGGFYSILPLPYARRLRITTSTVPNWAQITYARLPLDREIESFDPNGDPGATAAVLAASGTDPKETAPTITSTVELNAGPSGDQVVWEHDGPGTVLRLELFAPSAAADVPLDVRLRATWDDAEQPQVDAPLDDFFAAALGPGARSLAFGRDGDRFYCYLPMPFQRNARIIVRNDGGEPLRGWRLRIGAVDSVVARHPAHFYAHANSARLEPDGSDYTLLDRDGTGHVVAMALTAGCAEAGRCMLPGLQLDGAHLEGDERIAIDGSRYPQIHGTGLEDFFNGGFYFVRGAFSLPTHGNPGQARTSPRRPGVTLRSVYRLLLGDAIPFNNHIHLGIEHGPADDVPAYMSSLVLFYAIAAPTLIETEVTVSESTPADRELTSAFRGDASDVLITATGNEAATMRLRIAVPPDNRGIRLRRLADIGAGRQSAVVRVNGSVAGTWYSADVNPILRWAELDFDIPASFTAHRAQLDVEIDATDSPNPWTAYGYAAFSYVPLPDE